MLTTSGLYKVSVSNDGENYTELYASKERGKSAQSQHAGYHRLCRRRKKPYT